MSLKTQATTFLEQERIAVAGVSHTKQDAANIIYLKLREAGYDVFPVNPNAKTVEGDTCYPTLDAIPGGVAGVVIATHPDVAEQIVRQCIDTGVAQVWIHRSFGKGSFSEAAVTLCRENGLEVIPGACPMMFCEPVDVAHKCMRWVLGVFGGLPK